VSAANLRLALATGLVLEAAGLAAVAEEARSAFDQNLTGLSAFERAGVALWNFSPVAPAVAAAGAAVVALALAREPELTGRLRPIAGAVLAPLAAGQAALCALVLGLACWIAASGGVETGSGIRFTYSTGDRVATLLLQAVAFGPLAAFGAFLAARAPSLWGVAAPVGPGIVWQEGGAHAPAPVDGVDDVRPWSSPAPASEDPLERGERAWRERLAFSPRRAEAQALLQGLRVAAAAGDAATAGRLADELERL
jgi:hypothetical protein